MQTLVGCAAVGDRQFKPFWLGEDDLPPKPRLYGETVSSLHIPEHLYRAPTRLPGGHLGRVGFGYWPERDDLFVVVVTDERLGTAAPPEYPPIDLRIAGVRFDDGGTFAELGSRGWCYSAVWVNNPKLPTHDAGDRLTVDLVDGERRLARGTARVEVFENDHQADAFGPRFGCPSVY